MHGGNPSGVRSSSGAGEAGEGPDNRMAGCG
nr:MAG TPA: hypothetical protein [Caudoviricetes sp.]